VFIPLVQTSPQPLGLSANSGMLQAQPRQHPRKLQKKGSKSYTPEPVPNMEVADEELNVEAESNSVNAEPFSRLSITEEDEEVPAQ
jgi:hypothetical protein